MSGHRYAREIRTKALALGQAGKTYEQIREKYGVPKSTLSYWFSKVGQKVDRTRQFEHLKKARIASAIAKRRIRAMWVDAAAARGREMAHGVEMGNPAVSKALLAMLYWAEGSKHKRVHGLDFVNTDPELLKLYLKLLRVSFPIDESRFRARIHLHYYHSHREALSFWSQTLGIPVSQFGKIYVKKRSERKRFRKNFQGICFVRYPDSSAREELLALGRELSRQ